MTAGGQPLPRRRSAADGGLTSPYIGPRKPLAACVGFQPSNAGAFPLGGLLKLAQLVSAAFLHAAQRKVYA